MVFIDLEKVYDSPKKLYLESFRNKKVPRFYIELIKDKYANTSICVKTWMGKTKVFSMKVDLHQGSALSPYLFAFLTDELTCNIQYDALWCILFVDNVVLIDISREGVKGG